MVEYLTVLTTTDAAEKAQALAVGAVEAKVAACAQIDGPIISVYRWEGAVRADQGWRVLYKTTTERYSALETHIKNDYDTPEIIATPITHGSDSYLSWVSAETATE
ncbi:divalent-cation tolerance protein CutA [Streptomyces sp. NPDC087420]|uniref:divalent-cation tolerance protein CutA n=1 Tax=Streptomyces sp. NPDC087420 TaxID=3365785 RepID=UPI003833947A